MDKKLVKYCMLRKEGTLQFSYTNKRGRSCIMCFAPGCNSENAASFTVILILNVPEDKRSRVIDACNIINKKVPVLKFRLDSEGIMEISYDIPSIIDGDSLGELVYKLIFRTADYMDLEFELIMKALETDEPLV